MALQNVCLLLLAVVATALAAFDSINKVATMSSYVMYFRFVTK
jgi:hypothetical protein